MIDNSILKKIGIVMATKLEASPFLTNLALQIHEKKPFPLYITNDFILIISGIGKSNAALATSYLINKYDIKTLINVGAAGATTSEFEISTILQIEKIIELDRINIKNYKPVEYKLNTTNLFENTTLATQDKPVIEKKEREKVADFAKLVDMEGAGFIHACKIFNAMGLVFKIVTDTPEENTSDSIIQNIKKTREILFEIVIKKVLKNIINM